VVVDLNYIPKGWKKVKIPKVLYFQEGPGVRNWQFTETGVKLLNVGNINNGKINLSKTSIHLSEQEANGKYKHFLVDDGDLLIACSGIVVDNFHNKIAFAEKEHLPLCLNTSTMRFKALNDEVDLNYFKYYLQTVHFTAQLRKLITGSAQLNFGPSHIKKIDLLLPPLETQKRIAQILDDAATLRNKTEQLLKEYDALTKSIFLDMFGDPILNPKGWPIDKLKKITSKIGSGSTPKGGKESYFEEGISLIRSLNIHDNFFKMKDLAFIDDNQAKKLKNVTLEKNDVLLNITGASVARCTIVPEKLLPARVNQHVSILRPKFSILNSVFLLHLLISPNSKSKLLGVSSQGGATREAITKEQLESFEIIIPELNIQNQFAEKIALIEKQKELAKQELKESDDLFNCLLQKAFKGELV
jgi:type I restriction enzyme S subunit